MKPFSANVSPFLGACVVLIAMAQPSSQTVWMKLTSSPTTCLQANSNNQNGQQITFATCSSNNNYQKLLSQNIQTVYTIETALSTLACGAGMCMAGTYPGYDQSPIFSAPCNLTDTSQYWMAQAPPTFPVAGFYQLKSMKSAYCATVEGGGTYVDQYTCQDTGLSTNQLWTVQDVDDTGFNTVGSGLLPVGGVPTLCLDLKDANPNAGVARAFDTPACSATSYPQHFRATKAGTIVGSSMIRVSASGAPNPNLCFDGGFFPGPIYQYTCTTSAVNQQFINIFFPNDNTPGMLFMDLGSGYCITKDATSNNAVMATCTQGNVNQYFTVSLTA